MLTFYNNILIRYNIFIINSNKAFNKLEIRYPVPHKDCITQDGINKYFAIFENTLNKSSKFQRHTYE